MLTPHRDFALLILFRTVSQRFSQGRKRRTMGPHGASA